MIGALIAGLGIVVFLGLAISLLGGGLASPDCGTLFCWGKIPVLSGIDAFFTAIYNFIYFLSVWVALAVVAVLFITLNIMFIYFYYRLFIWLYGFKGVVQKFMNEVTSV